MDNKTLIQELIKEGLLKEPLAKKTLQEASLSNRNVEDLIYENRLINEDAVANIKSRLLDVPYKKIKPEDVDENLLKTFPEETVRNYKVVPLERAKNLLTVGMLNPDDTRAQDALKFIAKQLGVDLGIYLISPLVIATILRRYSPYRSEVEAAVKSLNLRPGQGVSPT